VPSCLSEGRPTAYASPRLSGSGEPQQVKSIGAPTSTTPSTVKCLRRHGLRETLAGKGVGGIESRLQSAVRQRFADGPASPRKSPDQLVRLP